jgi:hypothetical protein
VDIVVVLVPSQPLRRGAPPRDLRCVLDGAVRDLEQAGQERRAAFVGEREGVLGGQRVAARPGVVADESARGLGVQPFPGVGFTGLGAGGRLGCGRGRVAGQVPVVARLVAHHHQGAVQGGADFPDGAEHERHQLAGVDLDGRVSAGHGSVTS